jgi:hypothetical protein
MHRSTLSCLVGLALAAAITLASACGGTLSSEPGTKVDAGSGGDTEGGGADATSSDSGAVESDGGTAPLDAVAVIDVVTPVEEPAPTGPAVLCPADGGATTCDPGQFCCVIGNAKQGVQTDTCEPAGTACAGTPVTCAKAADCPVGQVCCGTQQTVGNVVSYVDVTCAASCTGNDQRAFCDQTANTCPPATPTCALSTLMPGYNVCQ